MFHVIQQIKTIDYDYYVSMVIDIHKKEFFEEIHLVQRINLVNCY